MEEGSDPGPAPLPGLLPPEPDPGRGDCPLQLPQHPARGETLLRGGHGGVSQAAGRGVVSKYHFISADRDSCSPRVQVSRQSTSELELDAVAADIINHQDVTGAAMNPGLVALWEDERCDHSCIFFLPILCLDCAVLVRASLTP